MNYNLLTMIQLYALCKERRIQNYSINRTKEKLIQLLKKSDLIELTSEYDIMKYDELLNLCKERKIIGYRTKDSTGKNIFTKENMINALKENNVKTNCFTYLTMNYPLILTKFAGDIEELKTDLSVTSKKYKWKCDTPDCPYTFEAITRHLYKYDSPRKYCDTCSHQARCINIHNTSLKRSGSIQSKFPFIKDIWSNDNIKTPNDFSPGSNESVILKCPNISKNHPDYKIDIGKIQEHNQFRCPKCITKSSNAEMRIYSELKQSFKDVRWQQKIEGREADITIEDLKLVIEIDGFPWHKDKTEKDLVKNAIFKKNGYDVLRIRDSKLDEILCDTIVCNLTELSLLDYNKIVDWINIKFNCNTPKYDVWKNVEYYKETHASKMYIKYEESIEYLFPESKDLWDYEQNHPFIPSQFSQGSKMEIWIKCSCGHSWKRKLCHLFRTINGKKYIMKCPECYRSKTSKTFIEINGKPYKSISECCRQLNINRDVLYNKTRKNKLDDTSITCIQKFIQENLESLQKR